MQKPSQVSLALCLLLGAASMARPDEQAELKKIVDKAIQVAGGQDKLLQVKAASWKCKSTTYGAEGVVESTGEYFLQMPDHYRAELTLESDGQTIKRTTVFNGKRCWVKEDGKTRPMSRQMLAQILRDNYTTALANNPAHLKNKSLRLALLGGAEVDDRPVVGIKVALATKPDVHLFFDKERGFLLKTVTTEEDGKLGKPVMVETFYSYHKEINGITIPFKAKSKRDGKLAAEMDLLEVKMFKEKLDEKIFARP